MEPTVAVSRVRNSAVREILLAYLHEWHFWTEENRDRLQMLLDLADDDEWRRKFRVALAAKDTARLQTLAIAPEAVVQPPVIVSGVGGILIAGEHRGEALTLLRQGHERFPGDFWINFLLGQFWSRDRPDTALGYLRVAVAIRPGSDQAYGSLGRALRDTGDVEGAIAAFRKAITLNPNSTVGKDLASALAAEN
jgi:tetratricopeptide (TPR) repeat protein